MEYCHSNVNMNQDIPSRNYTGEKSDLKKFYAGVLGYGPVRTKRDLAMNQRFLYAATNVHPNMYQTL